MNIYYWADTLYNLFTFTVLIPIFVGLSRWSRLTRPERWVLVFLAALLAHELLSIFCITLHTRNHFLYYLQTVLVLGSVAGVYDGTIGSNGFVWQVAILVSVLMVIEIVFGVGFNYINSSTLTISRLLAAVYALINLYRLFLGNDTPSAMPKSMPYIHAGFFIIGAFTAFNAYFKSYFIETSLDLYYLFNSTAAIMSAVAFGFFSVGFWQIKSTSFMQIQS